MSKHVAYLNWTRDASETFIDNKYSREHVIEFDGGASWHASSSPSVVPVPYSNPAAVDPEEMFVASVASCHMLWFLGVAAQQKYCVDSYRDEAQGVMQKNAEGLMVITQITLQPRVSFSGERQPTPDEITALHDKAHHACFIANSIKSEVLCQPIFEE